PRPGNRMSVTGRGPTYPTIPHMRKLLHSTRRQARRYEKEPRRRPSAGSTSVGFCSRSHLRGLYPSVTTVDRPGRHPPKDSITFHLVICSGLGPDLALAEPFSR